MHAFGATSQTPDKCQLPEIVSRLSTDELSSEEPTKPISAYKKQLVVHFDINETVLVGDEAGGDTREECLNKILAKSSFVKESISPTQWWNGTPIGEDSADLLSAPPPMYTGWNLPPGCISYYNTDYRRKSKTFTDHHGLPYRPLLKVLEKKVAFHHPRDGLPDILSHMIPALFHALKTLHERDQPCRFVFRTFGTDLPEIAEAVTAFARGLHPDFPFEDPTIELPKENLYRGRWAGGGESYELWDYEMKEKVAVGDEEILNFLSKKSMCGIQDDYDFWRRLDGCRY